MQKQKIEWMEQSEGSDYPQLVDELTQLSGILCAEHKFQEAACALKRTITMLETNKDYDGPRLATHLSMLAGIYLQLRQYADAEPLFGRALTIRELYLPANHPDISQSLHDYGWLLYKTNREHEGQKLLVQAHVRRK